MSMILLLQRGRAHSSAEIPSAELRARAEESKASTGPRSFERGNLEGEPLIVAMDCLLLQRGRAHSSAEMSFFFSLNTTRAKLQRGRAHSSAEIASAARDIAPEIPARFNGAALIRARKSSVRSVLMRSNSVLQRGRAHSSAEISAAGTLQVRTNLLQRGRAHSSAEIAPCLPAAR